MLAHTVDALHAVVNKVDLPPARQFTLNRTAHHRIAALHNVGLHRQTVGGWGLDDAHVARTRERHMQRTRDGRCRECQHIDPCCKLLDLLLLRDAKPLLLVHDQKA